MVSINRQDQQTKVRIYLEEKSIGLLTRYVGFQIGWFLNFVITRFNIYHSDMPFLLNINCRDITVYVKFNSCRKVDLALGWNLIFIEVIHWIQWIMTKSKSGYGYQVYSTYGNIYILRWSSKNEVIKPEKWRSNKNEIFTTMSG